MHEIEIQSQPLPPVQVPRAGLSPSSLVYFGLVQINLSIESDDFLSGTCYLLPVRTEECVIVSERRKGSSALVRACAYD